MSLHPRKAIEAVVPKSKPAPRPVYLFCGIPVGVQFSRRPRVLNLPANEGLERVREKRRGLR